MNTCGDVSHIRIRQGDPADRQVQTDSKKFGLASQKPTIACSRPRLAILTNMIPPYRVPVFRRLGRWFDVYVITAGSEDNRQWPHQDLGAEVRAKAAWGFTFKRRRRSADDHTVDLRYFHVNPGYIWELLRFRPNAIITGEAGLRSLLGLLYGRIFSVPVWIWWGGTQHTERCISRARRVVRRVIFGKLVERWISYGNSSTEYLTALSIPRERILQIQNCVDDQLYSKVAEPYALRVPSPRALFVGQLIGRKGIVQLLNTVARSRELGVTSSLVIVGDGPEADAVHDLAARLRITDLQHIPYIPPERMASIFQACDFLVFPTLEDVWGLVVNEALLAGRPAIASIFAGCARELLPQENLFNPLDIESFLDAYCRAVRGDISRPDRSRLMLALDVADMIAAEISGRLDDDLDDTSA